MHFIPLSIKKPRVFDCLRNLTLHGGESSAYAYRIFQAQLPEMNEDGSENGDE
jgi:hypothetical protein